MARASIPVDLFNPGQVFACMGFLEAAETLCGPAHGGFDWTNEADTQLRAGYAPVTEPNGGFDWTNEADTRFILEIPGNTNPVAEVVDFLAKAKIHELAPTGFIDAKSQSVVFTDTFPGSAGDKMALPIRLHTNTHAVTLGHWADGSGRDTFKLYAGNRTGFKIATDMLQGNDKEKTKGLRQLYHEAPATFLQDPLGQRTALGGTFGFDAAGTWDAMNAGFSPNEHAKAMLPIRAAKAPTVEILAAWGLQHARPSRDNSNRVGYATWQHALPAPLARAALGASLNTGELRHFHFNLDLSGKNKITTMAHEEILP